MFLFCQSFRTDNLCLFNDGEFINGRRRVFFPRTQKGGRVFRTVGGVGVALRFQAKRAMVAVYALAVKSDHTARGVKLYAAKRRITVHFSTRFFVVHVCKMFQAVAASFQAIVKIVPVRHFDHFFVRESVFA